MNTKKITCPYCQAPVTKIGIDLGKVTCEYCNQTFIVQKENETHLEKFYRTWHEEEKRRAEYQNTNEYQKMMERKQIDNKKLYIIMAICIGIIFLCFIIPSIKELINKLIDKI